MISTRPSHQLSISNFQFVIYNLIVLLAAPSFSQAALDPELKKPYHLRVILRIAEKPQFTDIFREQVKREVHDSIQLGLEELGRAEVIDASNPTAKLNSLEIKVLKELQAKDLQRVLDDRSLQVLSDVKTHFVLIDLVNDRYEIQARQHDGSTGLAGPVVRRDNTRDRLLVARKAVLLIKQDFGLVATLLEKVNDQVVKLALKAGDLGVPMERWVKKGEVFAIAQVKQGPNGPWSFRVPHALLQVIEEPVQGVCQCRLFYRYKDPPSQLQGGAGVLGYRFLKLGTQAGKVRLRLVDKDTFFPISNPLAVVVSAEDFDPKKKTEEQAIREGNLQTNQIYQHVAFVRIQSGASTLAQLPVEILDDNPIICPVTVDAKLGEHGLFEMEKRRWEDQVYERLLVLVDLRKELGVLIQKKAHKDALDKAQAGLAGLEGDIKDFAAESRRLSVAAKEAKIPNNLLASADQRLKELTAAQEDLKKSIANLQEVVKVEGAKKVQAELLAQAQQHEQEAEFQEAIDLYKKFLKDIGDNPEVRKRLEKLDESWIVKNDAHRQARKFIYESWPKLKNASDLKDKITEASQALETCVKVKDRLTPAMLYKVSLGYVNKLSNELDALKKNLTEDNKNAIKAIEELAPKLAELIEKTTSFLQEGKPAEK